MQLAFKNTQPANSQDEQGRRQAIWAQLRALQARVAARNTDLTEEDIEALADEIGREAMDALVDRGKVRFVRQSSS